MYFYCYTMTFNDVCVCVRKVPYIDVVSDVTLLQRDWMIQVIHTIDSSYTAEIDLKY